MGVPHRTLGCVRRAKFLPEINECGKPRRYWSSVGSMVKNPSKTASILAAAWQETGPAGKPQPIGIPSVVLDITRHLCRYFGPFLQVTLAKTQQNRAQNPASQMREPRDFDQVPARHRRIFPNRTPSGPVLNRALLALWPWRCREYPGLERLASWLLGASSLELARKYRKVPPSRNRARIVADRLRSKISELSALVVELDAIAAKPDRRKLFGKVPVPGKGVNVAVPD